MQTLDLAVSVFGVIFIAELPDKTALATLVLATRNKPFPVFLGAALALTVQSFFAVAAGSLFSLFPPRAVHIGAGLVFLVSAVIMWVRKDPESHGAAAERGGSVRTGDPQPPSRFWKTTASVFTVVFVAEWGDLTQLATAAFAARERAPLVVFLASTLALWAVTAIAILVGNRAAKIVSARMIQMSAAALFGGIGVALLFGWF